VTRRAAPAVVALLAAVVVAVVALGAPRRAEALNFRIKGQSFRLDITESLFSSYRGDLGSLVIERTRDGQRVVGAHFYDLINRLNLTLAWKKLRFFTRFDTAVYFDTPNGACGDPTTTPVPLRSRFCQRYFWLEKIGIEYVGRELEVTAGDFYVSFGRGLVLSLRKVDELGIDTTLLGGKVVVRKENVSATFVAGVTNVQNTDDSTGRSTPDPFDVIAGSRVELRLADKVILGIHEAGGVFLGPGQSRTAQRRDGMFMYGVSLDVPRATKWLSLYAEGAGQLVQAEDARDQGYALYASATAQAGPVSILVEAKHYSKFQRWRSSIDQSLAEFNPVAYNQPPTAERVLTELTSPIFDVTGPRLRLDWRATPWMLVFASTGYFEDRGSPDKVKRIYHDPYAGLEFRWQNGASHFFPSGGIRFELCGEVPSACLPIPGTNWYQTIGHVEWDFTQALPKRLSIESQGFALFREGEGLGDATTSVKWTEGNAYLALKWTPYLILVGGYEWSTRPSTKVNEHFFNGSVQWNITTASSLRLFAGGMRGGLRCISGICRDFPAFTGVRLEVVIRL